MKRVDWMLTILVTREEPETGARLYHHDGVMEFGELEPGAPIDRRR